MNKALLEQLEAGETVAYFRVREVYLFSYNEMKITMRQ